MRYGYKVLSATGTACHGGSGQWFLPTGRKPGKWMPKIADIEPCERGYHFCRNASDLMTWLNETIWVVEVRGKVIEADDKAVAEQARLVRRVTAWNEESARLFACACAKRALKYADAGSVETLRNTIKVAERFASGKAPGDEWNAARSAAESAARSAAESAAWNAAWSAEHKWQARKLSQMLRLKVPA